MAHHHQQVVEEKTKQIMGSSSSSSSLFCYLDLSSNPNINTTHLQSFDPNSDVYNLATGIEMIGFQPRGEGSGGGGGEVGGAYVEERTCVFPCEGNERPSQGLSLSLSSNNPSTIGLQSFELRHNPNPHETSFLGKSVIGSSNIMSLSMQFEIMSNSKYLAPTQELLNEFCSLHTHDNNNHNHHNHNQKKKKKKKDKEHWEFLDGDGDNDEDDDNNNNNGGSSSPSQSNLYGLSLLELQKRKTKLLALLEELDRRYRQYCEEMKGVVASLEGAGGRGSGKVYTGLASKAMSRHFRSLRDAIVGEIKGSNKAMGEKEGVPGTTKGETPRLRVLDQALRQQRAFQQLTMLETHPWRPQRGLPERSVSILRAWLFEHFLHPYPSDVDKHILARQTGLTRSQVSNWFINARVRLWKPMVEQMYLEETKEQEQGNDIGDAPHHDHSNEIGALIQPSNDQKPTVDQLLRVEPESLSSIINTSNTTTMSKRDRAQNPNHDFQQSHHQFGRVDAFGLIDLDFPSSSSLFHHAPYGTQNDNNAHQGFGLGGGGGGGNVSLTLGLQQHGSNGVGLAFSPASQSSLFYARDQIDDCQPVHQYSLLDGDQGQNLPYRNLMGAQLLHDFA